MTKVELVLLSENGEEEYKIINLIGIDGELFIHSTPDGELRFGLTERLRVLGKGFDFQSKDAIWTILERDDIIVYFINKQIFHNPNWGAGIVEMMSGELVRS